MASFHFVVKHSNSSIKRTGRRTSAAAHRDYICREGEYSTGEKVEQLVHKEYGNMPEWAKDNPRDFWAAADEFERDGPKLSGRTYVEFELDLPSELTEEQQIKLVRDFVKEKFGEDFPYQFAIHTKTAALDPGKENPHCHLMFSERALDGVERSRVTFFRQAARKYENPEAHGAKKNPYWNSRDMPQEMRLAWAEMENKHLEIHGHEVRVDPRTLEEQLEDAKQKGDKERIKQLQFQIKNKEKHLGPDVHKNYPPLTMEKAQYLAEERFVKNIRRNLKVEDYALKRERRSLAKSERDLEKKQAALEKQNAAAAEATERGETAPAAPEKRIDPAELAAEFKRIAAEKRELYLRELSNKARSENLLAELQKPDNQEKIAKIKENMLVRDAIRVEKLQTLQARRAREIPKEINRLEKKITDPSLTDEQVTKIARATYKKQEKVTEIPGTKEAWEKITAIEAAIRADDTKRLASKDDYQKQIGDLKKELQVLRGEITEEKEKAKSTEKQRPKVYGIKSYLKQKIREKNTEIAKLDAELKATDIAPITAREIAKLAREDALKDHFACDFEKKLTDLKEKATAANDQAEWDYSNYRMTKARFEKKDEPKIFGRDAWLKESEKVEALAQTTNKSADAAAKAQTEYEQFAAAVKAAAERPEIKERIEKYIQTHTTNDQERRAKRPELEAQKAKLQAQLGKLNTRLKAVKQLPWEVKQALRSAMRGVQKISRGVLRASQELGSLVQAAEARALGGSMTPKIHHDAGDDFEI